MGDPAFHVRRGPRSRETEKKKKKEVVAVLLVHCHEKEDMIVCPMKQIYM